MNQEREIEREEGGRKENELTESTTVGKKEMDQKQKETEEKREGE